ncbi:hypothetical protein STENM327S_00344 [Streptomyces tendae]
MPLSGTDLSCSLIRFAAEPAADPPAKARARSTPPVSRRTGYRLVNQPTVRDRSAPSTRCSSRPCPSRSSSSSGPPCRQRAQARANAVSSTSFTSAWKAAGTRVRTASVTSAGRVTVSRPAVASRSLAGSSGRRPGGGPADRRTSCHHAASATQADLTASSVRRCDQRRSEVPTGCRAGSRPAERASYASARSGMRMRQETPSTTRWWMIKQQQPGAVPPTVEPHGLHDPALAQVQPVTGGRAPPPGRGRGDRHRRRRRRPPAGPGRLRRRFPVPGPPAAAPEPA